MGIRDTFGRLKNWASGGWDASSPPVWDTRHPLEQASIFGSGMSTNREQIENNFEAYVAGAYKASGPVFACVQARQFVFSEAVFKFKAVQDGKLFGGPALSLLENPWPGGTTGELLARMEQDVSLAGNSWWTITNDKGQYGNAARGTEGARLAHLRPDWVTMVIGSKTNDPRAIDAHLAGITYRPLSADSGNGQAPKVFLAAEEIAHYSPNPDPIARFRGMSWITPVLKDVEADKGATKHKGAFFDNAAVPNMAVTFDKDTNPEDFAEFVDKFNGSHQGAWQAYKTLFLMGGADVTPLSHDFRSMDFSAVVGKGESRIASCAGVPPSWVGFSEGMQGSALNSGNMSANRRRFADGTIRPLWRIAVASLAPLIDVPTGAVLWWSEDDIAFLREDQKDRAEIMRIDLNAVDAGIKSGFEPDACVQAVKFNDISKLIGKHTGLVSVQMQPPVDPDNKVEETQGMANILHVQSQTIQDLIAAGFTEESVIEAVENNDLTKLKKAPVPDGWSPTGQPLLTPLGATPPGPAQATPPGKPPVAGHQRSPAAAKPPAGGSPKVPPAKSFNPEELRDWHGRWVAGSIHIGPGSKHPMASALGEGHYATVNGDIVNGPHPDKETAVDHAEGTARRQAEAAGENIDAPRAEPKKPSAARPKPVGPKPDVVVTNTAGLFTATVDGRTVAAGYLTRARAMREVNREIDRIYSDRAQAGH